MLLMLLLRCERSRCPCQLLRLNQTWVETILRFHLQLLPADTLGL